jgi:hypothetical protein
MSCVLRISGARVKASLSKITLVPYRLEGETAHFEVSAADLSAESPVRRELSAVSPVRRDFFEFQSQITNAITFLQSHKQDLKRLMGESGTSGVLDFAIEWRDVAVQFDHFHYPSKEQK